MRHLLALGGQWQWDRGETMFRAGERQGPFFKITSGVVAVSHLLPNGTRQVVAIRAPGDCVGYLDESGCYQFDGTALTAVEACAFDRRGFDRFAERNPALAAAVNASLSQALKETARQVVAIGQLKATARVAYFLLELDRLYQERRIATRPLTLHMTRAEIADFLGLTVETVSRSLGQLKVRGLITPRGNEAIAILDRDGLARMYEAAAP